MTTTPMLLRVVAASVLLLAGAGVAHAADTLVATCGTDGASFQLSKVSEQDAAMVYGLPEAPAGNAVLVVDAGSGEGRWSTASRSAIDQQCGGDGKTEIALFQPLQPRDGLWTSRMVDHDTQGCPSMIASRVKAMMPGIMQRKEARRLSFDKPFHPSAVMEGGDRIQWVQTGADRWRGLMMRDSAKGGMSVRVVVGLHVLSPTRMQASSKVVFDLPRQLAAMMGGGSGHCVTTARGDLTWSK